MKIHVVTSDVRSEVLLKSAAEASTAFLTEQWGLRSPRDLRVFLTAEWQVLVWRAAPWFYKFGNALMFAFIRVSWRSIWAFAAGVSVNYGFRKVIGIKPIDLSPQRSAIAAALYTDFSAETKFSSVVIHELTHAFTSHLFLPVWLNEGVALLASELVLETTVVKKESLELLKKPFRSVFYTQFARRSPEELSYHYAKGYWLTRYLFEVHPELFRDLLRSRFARLIWLFRVRKLVPSDESLRNYFLKSETLTG